MPSRHPAALVAALLLAVPVAGAAQSPAPATLASPAPRPASRPSGGTARGAAVPGDTLALTLADAVARALEAGDEVRLAETQLDATEAQIIGARATALPQLRLQAGYTQVLENARASIVGSVFGQNYNYNGNANLSVPLFQGGRAVGAIQGARAARASSRESVAETSAQVAVDVQRAYLGAIAAEELVRIQERNVALSSERLTQTEQFERAGRAARYDVLRARVERANLEPLLIQARADRELTVLELKRLLNVPAERPIRLTTSVRTDSTAVLALLARAAADTVVAPVRAAVRGAEAAVDARRAAVRVARADMLPTVSVFFQTGVLALPTSPRFPTAWGQASNALCPPGSPATRICQNNGFFPDRSAGVQFSWPLFDGLRAKGNMDLAQAQQRTAEVQLVQAREQVTLEAARARTGLERAGALWQAQRSNAREAEEAFTLATLRYQRGLGTQLEVSDAQLALLTARTNALRATLDVYLATAELARSLGKPIPLPE